MSIDLYEFALTSNASGAGTVTTSVPLTGRVVEIRMANAGTALCAGGTADLTFTRVKDGGTVLKLTNISAPFDYYPAPALNSVTGGTTAYSTGVGPVVSDDGVPVVNSTLQCILGDCQASASGTAYVYLEC